MSVTISAYKRCSVRLYIQLFVGGIMSYLRYLCLLAHSAVQHSLCRVFCFVCLRPVSYVASFSGLPPSWWPLRYSLAIQYSSIYLLKLGRYSVIYTCKSAITSVKSKYRKLLFPTVKVEAIKSVKQLEMCWSIPFLASYRVSYALIHIDKN
jgi:hypothetical protein